jgi:hypothetical protein
MDQDERPDGAAKPAPGDAGQGAKDERTLRREQALRANLRRRKAQTRARADARAPGKAPDEPE